MISDPSPCPPRIHTRVRFQLPSCLWLALVLPFVLTVIERLPLLLRAVSAIVGGVVALVGGPFLMARCIDSRVVPPRQRHMGTA